MILIIWLLSGLISYFLMITFRKVELSKFLDKMYLEHDFYIVETGLFVFFVLFGPFALVNTVIKLFKKINHRLTCNSRRTKVRKEVIQPFLTFLQ